MDPYKLEESIDQAPDFQKIITFFFNHLPSNFLLTDHVRYGQCLVSFPQKSIKSSSEVEQLSQERQRYRYIANNKQIFFMFMEEGGNRNFIKSKSIRIKYEDVIGVKLSGFYCGIMLQYRENKGEEQKKQRVINLQSINIGRNLDQQLRKYLIKCIGNRHRDNSQQYCEKTLLDFQRFKAKGTEIEDEEETQIDQDGDLIVKESQIRQIRVIDLKKKKNEVLRLFEKDEKIKQNKQNILELYKFYFQMTQKNAEDTFKHYIVEKYRKTKSSSSLKNLSILKIIPKKSLSKRNNLNLLYNQSQCYKNYKIITPYVPGARKLFQSKDNLVFQYSYFEGYTLRELIKKEKLRPDKKNLKQIIAQIIMALGHVHQCGLAYPASLDNVMVNYDGHIFLHQIGIVEQIKKKQKNEKEEQQEQEQEQGEKQDQQWHEKQQSKLLKVEKNTNLMSPEEIIFPQLCPQAISDWWCLGLLFYEIIVGESYYQGLNLQQIKELLSNTKKELNFQYLEKKTQKNDELANLIKSLLHKNSAQRIGSKNDYHTILDHPYFKGLNKSKIMRRQGQPLIKIKPTKISKELKPNISDQNQGSTQLKDLNKQINNILEECLFDRDLQFQ